MPELVPERVLVPEQALEHPELVLEQVQVLEQAHPEQELEQALEQHPVRHLVQELGRVRMPRPRPVARPRPAARTLRSRLRPLR